MRKLFLVAFIMAALTAIGNAQAKPVKGGMCGAYVSGHNAKFDCSHLGLGTVTIQEVYEKGWRVVAMTSQSSPATLMYIVVEEQQEQK